jgi:hypothetical protein
MSWQGAPLSVSLVGPSGAVYKGSGSGKLQFTHQVTAQEVQAGCAWVVSMSPTTKPTGMNANPLTVATGTISVEHPAVDAAKLAACKQNFAAQMSQMQQAKLAQLQAGRPSVSRSAFVLRPASEAIGIKPPSPPPPSAQPPSGIRSKLSLSERATKSGATLPPAAVITSVSAKSGKPGDQITITGSGFNNTTMGNVLMIVGNNLEWPATMVYGKWTDTSITVTMPDYNPSDRAAQASYPGTIYVFSGYGQSSNKVPFQYIPNPPPWHGGILVGWPQISSVTRAVSDRYIHDPSRDDSDWASIWVTHTYGFSFVGSSNTDYLFLQQHLQNGWTVAGIDFTPSFGMCGIVATGGDSKLTDDSAKVGSSNLQIGVHWWFDGMTCQGYRVQVWIQGPWGTSPGHPWCSSEGLRKYNTLYPDRCYNN